MGTVTTAVKGETAHTVQRMAGLKVGFYKTAGNWFKVLEVKTENEALAKATILGDLQITLNYGDFGEAEAPLHEATGKKVMNVEMELHVQGETHKTYGVVSDDGDKMTLKTSAGVFAFEKISSDEATEILDDGDPMEDLPTPYKIQPEKQGRLLWFTGPPGLGKSTTAQLFAREHDYVYYEADCFASIKNPYVPLDVDDPTMATMRQRGLKGEGLKRRQEVVKNLISQMKSFLEGEYNREVFEDFYSLMCDEIGRERTRIGGDWAVAQCVMLRDMRDVIRSKLGSDVMFVLLEMDVEGMLERVRKRHNGQEKAVESLKKYFEKCEPAGKDEEGIVTIKVTKEMNPQDVLTKVFEVLKLKKE